MTSAADLIARAEACGAELWFEGERLRFRAPKGALSDDLREALSAERDAVAAALRERARKHVVVAPASSGQQAHWFYRHADPESVAYNVTFAATIESPVEVAALRQALQAVSDRHAALRTSFEWSDEAGLQQRIAGWKEVAFTHHDETRLDEHVRARAAIEAANAPFDLANGPLFRASLHTHAHDRHVLILGGHHVVFDGASLFKAVAELRALYGEATGLGPARLPRAGGDPSAFTRWHEALLAGPEGARMEKYWTEALAAPGRRLRLPVDRTAAGGPRRPSTKTVCAPEELNDAVRRAAVARRVTPFVIYLAAYQSLLHRWTGADDVLVGTPAFFGRSQPEFEGAIGDFINTVPLRVRIRAGATVSDVVESGRAALYGALQAQDLPFPRIVEISNPVRETDRPPLIETLFNLMRFDEFRDLKGAIAPGADAADFAGLKMRHFPIEQLTGAFDLQLQVADLGDSVYAHWGYDAARFDAATIEWISEDYFAILQAIADQPDVALEALPCTREAMEKSGAALIERLLPRDIRVELDGDKIKLNAPKGKLDEGLRAEIAAGRDALVAALRAGYAPGASARHIAPLAADRTPQLSFAQRRLWFLDQFEPGGVRYNIGGGLRIRGALDIAHMRGALQDLFVRHEAFRTRITTKDGAPSVEILPESVCVVETVDLSDTAVQDRDGAATRVADQTAATPLSFAQGRLGAARIVRFAPDDHAVILVVHHIVSDDRSLSILIRDLRHLYAARALNTPPALLPLPLRYIDYAAWEQDRASAHGFDKASDFWRRTLAGAPPLLELPLDHARPPTGSRRGARVTVAFDGELVERLRETARVQGATMFMAFVGLWQALLSRLSGQEDVVVGTAVANRNSPALEDMVGFFVNSVPLRGDLGGGPSFEQLMVRTKRTVLAAFEQADLPFEALVEAVYPERTPAHAPIFQAMLTLHSHPDQEAGPGGLATEPIVANNGAARLDINLDITENHFGVDEGKLLAVYEYAADLFDEATIARWHRHFERLIEAACAAPSRSLASVPLLAPEEAEAFDRAHNATAHDYDRTRTPVAQLEDAAARHGDDVAVICNGLSTSYAALDARANQIAHALIVHGARPGGRVAVCLERSGDLPVALAAVWKAGAAYVPLDPSHPAARLRYVLEDAEISCAITTRAFAPMFGGTELVLLDGDDETIAAAPTVRPDVTPAPEDLAYVIYTSGSTGRPKGVEIEHRNLAAFLEAMRLRPRLRPGETLLAVTTPSFDIAGLELWLPLTTGATTIVASGEDTRDGVRLAGLLETHGVTMMQATPATWRLLLESGWGGKADLAALCGGEAMPQDLAQALLPKVAALWNVYGPTETTIWSTIHRVTAAEEARIPIGGPIANTRVYVLDASGALAPIGAPGALAIGGEGVARGYRNRPDLNAEKFVVIKPLSEPERVFQTGDLARWRADGTLDFLGRGDTQVKIRGFRIELGEIEARLAALDEVAAAVVDAREDVPGEKRLVAYVVPKAGAAFDEARVLAALRETLPDYMCPTAYVLLSRLPLSPNGKVDRKALPKPLATGGAIPDSSEALMSPTERAVAAHWRRLLNLDRVGLHQNFFDVGGHSLLLVKLQAALRSEFGREITVVELFQSTTIAAQAGWLAAPAQKDDALARARARAEKAANV